MSRVAPLLILGFPGCVLGWSYGCGPSVQSIHEGSVRFEHCYRLDLDRNIAASHRLACWRQWSKTYAYGQTRDRIEYARRRIRSLNAGESATLELDVAASAKPEPTHEAAPAEAPAPTNAHAPPPPIAAKPAVKPDAASASPEQPPEATPFAECLGGCKKGWHACHAKCSDEPGTRERPCSACKPDYRLCVRRCVE